eukprot:CAMPEP_0196767836 /NCGR_PEP_ID=MMETSP1095-20130614/42010_1 /TAXON_ID=96789 ORGANISM="Chromulina nebulosa, Strain UTEXLB2642" /NCGR_SAMPLE_ID=MMETSP1095 /ASSEMBLY_ACC=CAM_ASM_000446 /LENGTH=505 /DNA_ID=CAMNT_0042136547 /DNA_START=787 /DNA_END=2304 /DNA_ORIENTATION=+
MSVQKAKEFLDIDEEKHQITSAQMNYLTRTRDEVINDIRASCKLIVARTDRQIESIVFIGVQKAKEFLDIDEEKHQITSAQMNYLTRTRDEVINDIRASCKLIVARTDRQIESIVFIGPRESLKIAGTLLITELKYIDQMIQMDEEMRSKKMELATIKNQPFGGNYPNDPKTQKNTRFSPQYISNWKAKNIAKNSDNDDEPSKVISEGSNNNNRRRNNSGKFKDKEVDSNIALTDAPVKISNNSKVNSKVNSSVSANETGETTSRQNKNKSTVIVKPTSDQFPNRRQSANVATNVLNQNDNTDHYSSSQQTSHSNNNNRSTNRKKSNSLVSQDDIAITANTNKPKPSQTAKETIYVTVDMTNNQNLEEKSKKNPKESSENNLKTASIRKRLIKPSNLKSDENVNRSIEQTADSQKVDNQSVAIKNVDIKKTDSQKINVDSTAEGTGDKSAEKQVEKPLEKRTRNRKVIHKNEVKSNDSNDKSIVQLDELSQSLNELANQNQEVKT